MTHKASAPAEVLQDQGEGEKEDNEACTDNTSSHLALKQFDWGHPNELQVQWLTSQGVSFDALQVGARVLWEIKTHQFDTYPDFIQDKEIDKEMKQLDKERKAAAACGYDFVVGVSTQAHKDALLQRDQFLNIVVTGCKR